MLQIWMDGGGNVQEGHPIHFGIGIVGFHLLEEVILHPDEMNLPVDAPKIDIRGRVV